MLNSKEILQHTKDLTILFAEDYEELRVNTSEILKKFFHTVDTAKDGEVALKMYNNSEYDIVISDIQMPKMNGITLVENIYKKNPKQAIIVLSAHDDTKYLLPLINLKIEHFLKKPIDYQELLDVLLNTSKSVNKIKNNITSNTESNIININNTFTFNKDNGLLYNEKDIITLTKFEIIFMQLISDNIGKICSNEDITLHYKNLNENLDMANIRKLVSKLRKKLPSNTIESLYSVGYRLIPFI